MDLEVINTRATRLLNSSIEILEVANEVLMNIDRLSLEESEIFLKQLEEKDIEFTPVPLKPFQTPKDVLIVKLEAIIEELIQLKTEVECYDSVRKSVAK